jgi:hypothetical protein
VSDRSCLACLFRWLFANQSKPRTGSLSAFSAFSIHPQTVQSIQTNGQEQQHHHHHSTTITITITLTGNEDDEQQ